MGNFYTDVIQRDPRYGRRGRVADPDLLEPIFRALVMEILAEADAQGNPLMLFETVRSPARQQLLYTRGVTGLKKVGVHAYGLAGDLVKDVDGEPSWKGDFSFLGILARKRGLVWGGDWPHRKDMVHVQRLRLSDQPALFRGEFYPGDDYAAADGPPPPHDQISCATCNGIVEALEP